MKTKLTSDIELNTCANKFFDLAVKSLITDPRQKLPALAHGNFRMLNGLLFSASTQILEAQHHLVSRCTKLLGPKMGHEKEIENIAWECVCQSLEGDEKTSNITNFIGELVEHVQAQYEYVMPNYALHLIDVPKIKIGPVEAMLTELLPEIQADNKNRKWKISAGKEFQFRIADGEINFEMPPVVWRVSAQVVRGHLEEEAIWLVNIALSLLRLSFPDEKRRGLFPMIGESEALPITLQPITKQGITFSGHGGWGGETKARKLYEIDADVIAVVSDKEFINIAEAIFSPSERSLAARFAQGLGWMSRGRQSTDRAGKFLFFFTAIEALLSSDDKTSPIVQTVSRYVAVILQDDAKKRFELASTIKSLYALRSTLVHTGKRNVSNSDVSTIQLVTEALYFVVMHGIDLKTTFEKFHGTLAEASYGQAWGELLKANKLASQLILKT